MASQSPYSQFGMEMDESAELGADYMPPPPSAYGGMSSSAAADGGLNLEQIRRHSRQAKIVGLVASLLAVLVLVGGSFFWWVGLQNISRPLPASDPIEANFLAAKRSFENLDYIQAADSMQEVIDSDKSGKFKPTAILYVLRSLTEKARLDGNKGSSFIAASAQSYSRAVTFATKYSSELQTIFQKPDSAQQALLPAAYKSLDDWKKALQTEAAQANLYQQGMEANLKYRAESSEANLTHRISRWKALYETNKGFFLERADNSAAAIELIKAYQSRINNCATGKADLEEVKKIVQELGSKLPGNFAQELAENEKDFTAKCSGQ